MISVLINAYAVSPNHGSEPGMAWNWIVNLGKFCKVHIITEGEWQKEIEEALEELPQCRNIIFYYNPVSTKIRKMCWNQGDWRFYYYYNQWQKLAYTKALEICKSNQIDLVHHMNMIGFREPGYFWKIKDRVSVWGPVGGFNRIPFSFLKEFGLFGALKQMLKQTINKIQVFQPNIFMAIKNYDLIIAANSEAKLQLGKFRKDAILMNETGSKPTTAFNRDFQSKPIRLIWVGKLVARKALFLAIRTMKLLTAHSIELDIIGVDKGEVQNIPDEIQKNIFFYKWMPHEQVQSHLKSSHAMLFTSLDEGTPHVVLEAIASGLPVICHDVCGQGDVINETCGIKIPLNNPEKSVESFTEAILRVYNDRTILKSLSEGAFNRANELAWENKARDLIRYYETLETNTLN